MNSHWPSRPGIATQTAVALMAMMGAGIFAGGSEDPREIRLERRPGETKEEHEARAEALVEKHQAEVAMKQRARDEAMADYEQRCRQAYEAEASKHRDARAARKAAAYAKRQPKGTA